VFRSTKRVALLERLIDLSPSCLAGSFSIRATDMEIGAHSARWGDAVATHPLPEPYGQGCVQGIEIGALDIPATKIFVGTIRR